MTTRYTYILSLLLLLLPLGMEAQTKKIRYVCNSNSYTDIYGTTHTLKKGAYTNDGLSWDHAKLNIQDAINDLKANLRDGETGEVWVAAGTYTPTESTEADGGSTLYMSFKIPAGITVRGGFIGNETTSETGSKVPTGETGREMLPATSSSVGESTKYRTTLSGSLNQDPTFEWNATKQQWNTSFYGNCYHVVWFATNGFDSEGRAKPLGTTAELKAKTGAIAKLEGFVIQNGNAHNTSLEGHPHNAYGGGVYMVPGAEIENCYITQCEASRDGGAVYCDGGGSVRHCYIANCQALGSGLESGYGGAICLDENKQVYPPIVVRTSVVNCVGRYGGGIATKCNHPDYSETLDKKYDMRYNWGVAGNLIANCTATTEGGGVYSLNGGAFTQLTVVNNKCNGTGVTVNGMETGRSAGIYMRGDAILANSVLWGGKCKNATTGQDAQMAMSRETNTQKARILYTALSNADYVDWSGSQRQGTIVLSKYNTYTDATSAGVAEATAKESSYPAFMNPSAVVGYEENAAAKNYKSYVEGSSTNNGYSYKLKYSSALSYAGVLTRDLDTQHETPTLDKTYDIQGNEFEAYSTLGAYVPEKPNVAASVDQTNHIAHIYVDPNSTFSDNANYIGSSWSSPLRFLGDLSSLITANIKRLDNANYQVKEIQVHVKEGTINTNGAYSSSRVRSTKIEIPKVVSSKYGNIPLTILGGYSSDLTYDASKSTYNEQHALNDATKRNPLKYPSIITGNTIDDYDYNVPHLVVFDGVTDVTFDGFQVRYANALSTNLLTSPVTTGAGITINNSTDISIKNCLVANCTASDGSAVYATGSTGISFENCIFHNNDACASLGADGSATGLAGTITSDATSTLTFNHCDVLRNLGYAFKNDGTVTMDNSICYANMNKKLDDTNGNEGNALVTFSGSGDVLSALGSKNLFDTKSSGDSKAKNIGTASQKFVFESGIQNNYPAFRNPTKNSGVSKNGDATYYGTAVSFEPQNTNDVVNAAAYSGTHDTWGTDMSTVINRDYGGLPDIGALESYLDEDGNKDGQRPYGSVMYVRDYNTYTYNADGTIANIVTTDVNTTRADGTTRDGSSWELAINGNADYQDANGAVNGYFLKTPDGKYVKYGSITDSNQGDHPTLAVTDTKTDAEYFTFSNMSDNATVYANRTGLYFNRETRNSYYYMWLYSSGTAHTLTKNNDGTYYISATVSNKKWYLYVDSNNHLAYRTNAYAWTFEEYSNATIKGFQYAVNVASEKAADDNEAHDVYVGAGKYTVNLTWKNGANVQGGFPNIGNPGQKERNISNSNKDYNTIVDGNATGRVLTQAEDFTVKSTFEGFIIQNGSTTGAKYGAGAYLMKNGVLKNCLVKDNTFTASSSSDSKKGGGGIYMNTGSIVENSIIKGNYVNANDQSKYMGGAGVYANGGTLINSLIVENTTQSDNFYILGSGFYISSQSYLYNCTIAYNFADEKGSYAATGGVWDAAATQQSGTTYKNQSQFYNCIMWGNYATGNTNENFLQVGMSGWNNSGGYCTDGFHDCYSSAINETLTSDDASDNNKVEIIGGTVGISTENATAFYNNCKSVEPFVRDENGTTDYSLKSTATQCINKGGDEAATVLSETYSIDEDIQGDDRIQDCTIDKGAYEYNGAYGITPDITSETGKAIYYVTPGGSGTASASDPANAACAAKLQKVIDAAGRYKYQNKDKQVIVKVANSYSLLHPTSGSASNFTYYACRTTDQTGSDQDVRIWSIIIPRGVEVWGGYTDEPMKLVDNTLTQDKDNSWDNAHNGFYSRTGSEGSYVYTDLRDIIKNPTYFDATYTNKDENTEAIAYHVVSFSNNVFDANGVAYKNDDTIGEDASTDGTAITLDSSYGRAVLDGIFVSGGQADINSSSSTRNINQMGGAALVTDYAHVRNCILENNSAVYGGALALEHGALVSGCLIKNNSADYGGALYVIENGTSLSDGTTIDTGTAYSYTDDDLAKKPHVYTSTITNNTATKQGGGIWFNLDDANVRINSVAIWKNTCNQEANVYGNYSPTKADNDQTSTEKFFPFAYSAVENMRMSGANNIKVETQNSRGTRFATSETDATVASDDATDLGYYALTNYSTLLRTGMPVVNYDNLVSTQALSATDFTAVDREISTSTARTYIDIGARALDKELGVKQLMLRLFVAQPNDVNVDAATTMMNLASGATAGSDAEYYSQEGSSFAYPFQNLQDALDYIVTMRSKDNIATYHANDLPFEICMARGTYYPTKDLANTYGNSLSNTFAVPEGVSIVGGFSVDDLGSAKYYGRYNKANYQARPDYSGATTTPDAYFTTNNVTPLTDKTVALKGITLQQSSLKTMEEARARDDVNGNNIIEPWEFKNETVLDGNATNEKENGVYHILTVVPDENVVGVLPTISIDRTLPNSIGFKYNGTGYEDYEEGQTVELNGLIITGGYAEDYLVGQVDDMSKYNYYHGGGLLVDGNRYCNFSNSFKEDMTYALQYYNAENSTSLTLDEFKALDPKNAVAYMHAGHTNAVGFRDIPLCISQCKFRGNYAGYGGAISCNSTLDLLNSSLEDNLAENGEDTNVPKGGSNITVKYPGQGGAVFITHHLSAINTLFANNEAKNSNYTLDLTKYTSYRNPDENTINGILGGCGGAVYGGKGGYIHLVNCDVVRNKANVYPAVFTMCPNNFSTDYFRNACYITQYNQITNTVVWGNELNENMNITDEGKEFAANLICNYGKPGRTGDYSAAFDDGNYPTNQSDLDSNFMETAWFAAYEEGRGRTANNDVDMRDVDYRPYSHVMALIALKTGVTNPAAMQNCNITVDSDNATLEGPNFGNPSTTAGNAGYMESADWSPARLNNMTDQGSGKIVQNISTDGNYTCTYPTYTEKGKTVEAERSAYSCETENDIITTGCYPTIRFLAGYPDYNNNLPLGTDTYMQAVSTSADDSADDLKMLRISYDPNPTHQQTYIDIGVYEYKHTQLQTNTIGDEVDILWVSTKEKPENGVPNGYSWSTPTSDLQRAIETLLASRNGHRKEIRVMDGTYTPIYTINNSLSFYIDTEYLNNESYYPAEDEGKGVKSLTIKGGYSKDLRDQYDVDLYPAIIRQQVRTDDTSDRWNHLFYIKDASQRYGSKTYGNTTEWNLSEHDNKVNTVPIEIDGLTLVNDQAMPNAKGAAIYYEDQTFNESGSQSTTDITYNAEAPTDAYLSVLDGDGKNEFYTDDSYATKQTTQDADGLDGSTNYHNYVDKTAPAKLIVSKCTVYGTGNHNDILTNDNSVSAVYLGQHGGECLIYNNVFHTNYGNPLVAYNATTINNTFGKNYGIVQLMNQTGLTYKSKILNSVFWKNNPTDATTFGSQFSLDGLDLTVADALKNNADIFSYNAYTGGNTEGQDYVSTTSPIVLNNYNVGLKDDNSDVVYGPNFTDPENTVVASRDFTIKPSIRLLNRGDNNKYLTTVECSGTNLSNHTADTKDSDGNTIPAATIYDYAWVPTTTYDAASNTRIMLKIELGAYEYQNKLQRVMYVDPNKSQIDLGTSWANPLTLGNIQNAIDLAGVYAATYNEDAYVFVKAASPTNLDLHTGETLTMRNGVRVYGDINYDYNTDCPYLEDDDKNVYYDSKKLEAYIQNFLIYYRNGLLSPTEGHTKILGINTTGTQFKNSSSNQLTSLMDGFEITNVTTDNPTGKVSAPVIDVDPTNVEGATAICLRNIAVHDNDFSDSGSATEEDLVNINNALLYEVLIHSNKVADGASVLNVGTDGYVVNATVEGKTTGADGSTALHNLPEANSHVYYSLTNFANDDKTTKTFSGYCYKMEDQNLNYQLTENSTHIDEIANDASGNPINPMATVKKTMTEAGKNFYLDQFINYKKTYYTDEEVTYLKTAITKSGDTSVSEYGNSVFDDYSTSTISYGDRDVLGNFRYQCLDNPYVKNQPYTAKLDRGAFETWKVMRDAYNVFPDFPHDGTCEYIMKGKKLVIDPIVPGIVNSAHEVGFCLLQDGASLYGSERDMQLSYVAVERDMTKDEGRIVAVPYAMNYNTCVSPGSSDGSTMTGAGLVTYDSNGIISFTQSASEIKRYDAAARSSWDYVFKTKESACWQDVAASETTDACNGVWYQPTETGTYRFVYRGSDLKDYIYTEDGTAESKTVELTQNDDRESNSGSADFTSDEDMGWNCIGIPFLVSEYRPYKKCSVTKVVGDDNGYIMTKVVDDATALSSTVHYGMDIPHNLWLYYDGKVDADGNKLTPDGTQSVNGDDGYYSVPSWSGSVSDWHLLDTETPCLWVGEGIFTQTAAVAGTETLEFHFPVYDPAQSTSGAKSANVAKSSKTFNSRYYYGIDDKSIADDVSGDVLVKVKKHDITVEGLESGDVVTIVNAAGQLVNSGIADSDTYKFTVGANGIYVIAINNHQMTRKVLVK